MKAPRFGGLWTTRKLEVLAGYLRAYTTALQDKPTPGDPFRKAFIDAFAGTGYRNARPENDDPSQGLLFPDLAEGDPQGLLRGSATIGLQTEPRFDKYIFIEQSPERCAQLKALKIDFPHLAADIDIRPGEANAEIQELCSKDWRSRRAVLFLDPFGMQVEWATIAAVAATKAIDLWLLFPLGIGVNRLVVRSGQIPEVWSRCLDRLLGTKDWRKDFYSVETTQDLFGNEQELLVKARMETIGRYFNNRLMGIFAGVADPPGVLRNSTGSPLYLLCFAVSNERGKAIALRIAQSLLKELH